MANVAVIEFSQFLFNNAEKPSIEISEDNILTLKIPLIMASKDGDREADVEEQNQFRDATLKKNLIANNPNIKVKLIPLQAKSESSTLFIEANIETKVPGTGAASKTSPQQTTDNKDTSTTDSKCDE